MKALGLNNDSVQNTAVFIRSVPGSESTAAAPERRFNDEEDGNGENQDDGLH